MRSGAPECTEFNDHAHVDVPAMMEVCFEDWLSLLEVIDCSEHRLGLNLDAAVQKHGYYSCVSISRSLYRLGSVDHR